MIEWTESAPSSSRADPEALARAVDLVRARGGKAQLCVLSRGTVVLDRSFGCAPDDLFWIFSASKPFIALLIHKLAEQGELALDHPVAAYWPEFAHHGKQAVTIRHVLQHRSGVPVARNAALDMLTIADWDRAVHAVERARPTRPPGQCAAYHIVTYGVILGELARRITRTPLPDALRSAFFAPLSLHNTSLGISVAQWSRHVPVRGADVLARATAGFVNRKALRQAVIPAAGISTTARDLARFYQALLNDGELDGVRILNPDALARAREPSTAPGEVDRVIRLPIRWSHGFQLGGPTPPPHPPKPMGADSDPRTFGHNGSNCCIAWADPTRALVFAYLTDHLQSGHAGARHMAALSDAVISACP
ncbi:MAG TPA: serine hydrolase domain-containing protein [Actinocrinis sp.]|nr:serine hydrolase domain-containing protein [Actinocrinis sp.]